MTKVAKSLTILAITLITLAGGERCYGKTEARSQTQAPPTIQGEHISQVFAATCAESTFAEFQAWTVKTRFSLRQFDSPTYQITADEIKDDNLLFSVKINAQNKWQATIRDQKFEGDDPCDTAMAYLNSRSPKEPKQLSLLTFLIPEARAEKLVNETTTTNWLLGALATAALTDGPFLENIANKIHLSDSILLASAFRAIKVGVSGQQASTTDFDSAINQKTGLSCSHNRVTITGVDQLIIIKKGYVPYRLAFEDTRTGKPFRSESQILAKGKVHDHIVSLGQRCNHDGDAAEINAQLQSEHELLNLKVAKSELLNRSVSSATTSAAPEVEKQDSAPNQ